jgi:thiamine-phosphate diphosphorylase
VVAPVVCFVTPSLAQGAGDARALLARVAAAARAGVHLIQVRQPALEGRALLHLVRQCVTAVASTPARVVVNDRLDVALAASAHGVHLRGDGPPAVRVRALAPRGFLVGRSVHAADEARAVAAQGGVDYLIFGAVFPTSSKPGGEAAGIGALADVSRAVTCPVLAIGGITVERIPEVSGAGAAGLAGIGLFTGDPARLPAVVAAARRAFGARGQAGRG